MRITERLTYFHTHNSHNISDMASHPNEKNGANRPPPREIKMLDSVTRLMDNQFRIPRTNIRFGLDPLIGLIPGVGDVISYAMGSALILAMVRHGASVRVVLKMLWNLTIDTVVGAFPVLGDIFDIWFKSNRRNYRIYGEYIKKNEKGRPLWVVILILVAGIAAILFLLLYLLFFWLPSQIWAPN